MSIELDTVEMLRIDTVEMLHLRNCAVGHAIKFIECIPESRKEMIWPAIDLLALSQSIYDFLSFKTHGKK